MSYSQNFYLILASIIFGFTLIGSTYYYKNIYEKAEDCFVREMTEWAEKNDELENRYLRSIIEAKDSKKSVAVARAYLRGDSSQIPKISIRVNLDYCGLDD